MTIPPYLGAVVFNNEKIGTGFLVSANGLVATCHHVVAAVNATSETDIFHFEFFNGPTYTASFFGSNPLNDVALLQLHEPTQLPKRARLVKSQSLEAGMSFTLTGYALVAAEDASYRFASAQGTFVGYAERESAGNRVTLLQLRSQEIMKGMSGSPIYVPDVGGVVGILSERYEVGTRDPQYFAQTAFGNLIGELAALTPEVTLHDAAKAKAQPEQRAGTSIGTVYGPVNTGPGGRAISTTNYISKDHKDRP